MRPSHDERGPATPFERGFYVFLLTVVLALFAAEIATDFHPAKLGALFFVLFWPPCVVLHEAGHALMAALVNWEVRRIVIGFNRTVWRLHFRGIPVHFKAIPIGGYVVPVPHNLSGARAKCALIYLAGPGIELVAVLILAAVVGRERLLTRSEDVGMIAMQSFAVVCLYGALTNLLPFAWIEKDRTRYSDGLGFFRSFTMKDEEFVALMYTPPEEDEEEEDWERDREDWSGPP